MSKRKCSKCIYRAKWGIEGIEWYCNYLSITYKMRPCSVEDCTVFKRGAPITERKFNPSFKYREGGDEL